MNMMRSLVFGLMTVMLLSGCGNRKPVLHVYNWADYMDPELIAQFEEEFGVRVRVDTFDSNEAMYAKLRAGASGYDLLFPSSYMVSVMAKQDMLQPLDHSLLPNRQHLDPAFARFSEDPGNVYSIPYMVSYTGIAYRKDLVESVPASWKVFEQEALAGRMTMLNDMRETIGAALMFLGYRINSTDQAELEAARDVVIGWKRNLAKFENEQYKTGLAAGEFFVVHGYSGDILQVAEDSEDIVFFLPAEGFSIARDDMCIPVDAGQPALAHAFINFLHRPDIAARNMEWVAYLCPNQAAYALVDEELRQNPAVFLPPEMTDQAEVMIDLGEDIARYTSIWDQIKAAN